MNFGAWPSSLSSLYVPSISNLLHGYVLKYTYTEMTKTLYRYTERYLKYRYTEMAKTLLN